MSQKEDHVPIVPRWHHTETIDRAHDRNNSRFYRRNRSGSGLCHILHRIQVQLPVPSGRSDQYGKWEGDTALQAHGPHRVPKPHLCRDPEAVEPLSANTQSIQSCCCCSRGKGATFVEGGNETREWSRISGSAGRRKTQDLLPLLRGRGPSVALQQGAGWVGGHWAPPPSDGEAKWLCDAGEIQQSPGLQLVRLPSHWTRFIQSFKQVMPSTRFKEHSPITLFCCWYHVDMNLVQ